MTSNPTHGGKRKGAGRKPGIPNKPKTGDEPKKESKRKVTQTFSIAIDEVATQAIDRLMEAWQLNRSQTIARAVKESIERL